MGKQVRKSKEEIATIDCNLITIETAEGEFGFDTANQISVEPQTEEEDAVKLVVKGILRAQKPKVVTITGHEITLTDNVFNPELVLVLQGGTIKYAADDPDKIIGYAPPIAGSSDKGEKFKLNAYTAQYDASGQIVQYEKITYPNCQGVPVAFGSEDGAFRAPEYTIISAPKQGEAPYEINYVNELPELVENPTIEELEVTSTPGTKAGYTRVSVAPAPDSDDVLIWKRFETESNAVPEVKSIVLDKEITVSTNWGSTSPNPNYAYVQQGGEISVPSEVYIVVVKGKDIGNNIVKAKAVGYASVSAL